MERPFHDRIPVTELLPDCFGRLIWPKLIYQVDMRATHPVVFVSISIVIIEIEEMPRLGIPKQMPGKQRSFVKCGLDLIGGLLSGWLKSTDAVPRESRKV